MIERIVRMVEEQKPQASSPQKPCIKQFVASEFPPFSAADRSAGSARQRHLIQASPLASRLPFCRRPKESACGLFRLAGDGMLLQEVLDIPVDLFLS